MEAKSRHREMLALQNCASQSDAAELRVRRNSLSARSRGAHRPWKPFFRTVVDLSGGLAPARDPGRRLRPLATLATGVGAAAEPRCPPG